MANASRRKGIAGEAEVAAIWRAHGFDVQSLQHNIAGVADQLVLGHGLMLLCDPKRQEKTSPWEWYRQMQENVATAGVRLDGWAIPFRRSRSPWLAIVGLNDLARLLA